MGARTLVGRGAAVACLALLVAAGPAAAADPAPAACAPKPIAAAAAATAQVCVHHVLVTETTATKEQNSSNFTVTDGDAKLDATVPNWWPNGGPTAGMVITMWGKPGADGVFRVDRWLDRKHGSGPAPDGPYKRERAVDIAAGRIPEHRMVWVATYVFLLDPQDGGDGDIHVQTANGCPGAGVTTETTPPYRGYVDHPALPGQTSSMDTSDEPSGHLADAPPAGVPVMILGATRYDYGFGWYELHPIRAWRFLTSAELAELAAECSDSPVPEVDQTGPAPVPFGFPPCTDGSEFGDATPLTGCAAQCYVSHTAIGQLEQLTGPCTGKVPIVTPSQETFPDKGTSESPNKPPPDSAPPPGSQGGGGGGGSSSNDQGQSQSGRPGAGENEWAAALTRVYGNDCKALRSKSGRAGRWFRICVLAMARLAGGETSSPHAACRREPRHIPHKRRGQKFRGSYRRRCVVTGRALLRRLGERRVEESGEPGEQEAERGRE
jgi:hypothetical protein